MQLGFEVFEAQKADLIYHGLVAPGKLFSTAAGISDEFDLIFKSLEIAVQNSCIPSAFTAYSNSNIWFRLINLFRFDYDLQY